MSKADIAALLARVRAATGPDEGIGIAIYEALEICSYIPDEGDPTESIDAIVYLIERELPAWQWAVWGGAIEIGHTSVRCIARISDGDMDFGGSDYPSAPLALCAAFLLTKLSAHSQT